LVYLKVLAWHSLGETDENQETPESLCPVMWLRFKLGISRIQVYIVTTIPTRRMRIPSLPSGDL
jgi:hypothetical protein